MSIDVGGRAEGLAAVPRLLLLFCSMPGRGLMIAGHKADRADR